MQVVTVSGGTLFHVAEQYLKDATQWDRIAELNGLDDPVITGVVDLKIPNVDLSQTGGVLDG